MKLSIKTIAAWFAVAAGTVGTGPSMAAGQPTPASSTRAAYASAAALQEQGLYDLAADGWRELLRRSPEDPLAPRARYNLGVCRFHSGAFDEAAEKFATVADRERFPDLAETALANLGLARLNAARTRLADPNHDPQRLAEQLTKAVGAFDRGIADFGSGTQAAANHFHRGEALVLLAKPKQAAESFRRVLDGEAGKSLKRRARVGLGNALLDTGNFEEIAAAVAPVVDDSTAPLLAAEARLLRAEAALATDRPADAAGDFDRASQAEGFVDAAYAAERAAFSWYAAGENPKAAEAYLSLFNRFPNEAVAAGAQLSAGKCWLLADQPVKAAETLAAAWEAAPGPANTEAALWWGRALLAANQPTKALSAARGALATKPLNASPLRLLMADAMAADDDQRPAASAEYEAFADTWPQDPAAGRVLTLAAGIALESSESQRAKRLAGRVLQANAREPLATNARAIFADASLRLKEWPEAIAAFEELLATAGPDARHPHWLRSLADAFVGAGKQDEAVAALGRLIKEHPVDPRIRRARYDRGRLLTIAEDLTAANDDFRTVFNAVGNDNLAAYARLALATNQHAAGDYQSCIATLLTLLAAAPTAVDQEATFLLANAHHALGQFGAALKRLDDGEPQDAEHSRLRAQCLIGLKRFDAATRAVDQCEQQGLPLPRLAELRYELGWMNRDAGRKDEALTAFTQAAELQPNGALAAESWFRVGEIHSDGKAYERGSTAFAAAARIADGELREQALHLLGWSRWNASKPAEAAKAFRKQLDTAPAGKLATDGRLMLGESLFAQEHYAPALAEYRGGLKAGAPSNRGLLPLALLHAGQAAGQTDDWRGAFQLLNRATKEVPDGKLGDQVAYERAWALHKLGRNAEAAPVLDQLAEKANSVLAARAAFVRGELHFAAGEHALAVRMFYRVAYGFGGRDAPPEYHPWQAESLFEAARCLELLDRVDPARKVYAELLERFPESSKALLARDRIPDGK